MECMPEWPFGAFIKLKKKKYNWLKFTKKEKMVFLRKKIYNHFYFEKE